MKKFMLTFILTFIMLLANATTNYVTEFELNKYNDNTYCLITLITNKDKFSINDSSQYVIELNNGKIIMLNPVKKTNTALINKTYIVYYATKEDISNIVVDGVKTTYQCIGNTVIQNNFKYNEFSKKIILETNNIIHNMNLIF